jgi:hypothetical protein
MKFPGVDHPGSIRENATVALDRTGNGKERPV